MTMSGPSRSMICALGLLLLPGCYLLAERPEADDDGAPEAADPPSPAREPAWARAPAAPDDPSETPPEAAPEPAPPEPAAPAPEPSTPSAPPPERARGTGGVGAACSEELDCTLGFVCMFQRWDCSPSVRGVCAPADFCETWLIPFCGCDGTTFSAPGNCVTRPHQHAGACR